MSCWAFYKRIKNRQTKEQIPILFLLLGHTVLILQGMLWDVVRCCGMWWDVVGCGGVVS